MMAENVRKLEEVKDIADQQENDQFISNYRVEASKNGLLELKRREKEHIRLMAEMDDNLVASLAEFRKKIEKDEKEFEASEKQLLESMQNLIRQKTGTYDAITTTSLASIEERRIKVEEEIRKLDKERAESDKRRAAMEVELSKARFEEAKVAREKQEKDFEEAEKELQQKALENQSELLNNAKENRAHANTSTSTLVAQIRSDAQNQVEVGLQNVHINVIVNDRRNRTAINEKIHRVKSLAAESVETHYGRAFGVLSMDTKNLATLKKPQLRQTANSLTQFHENLGKIREELDNTDQLLAGWSLEGVDKAQEIRLIKAKISQFAEVIFPLKVQLKTITAESGFDKALVETFKTLKDELNDMINSIATIGEERVTFTNAIAEPLPKGTSSTTVKAIQN